MHDFVFQVLYHSKFLKVSRIIDHLFLNIHKWVIWTEAYLNWHFIGVIIEVDKAIVEQESAVALLAITVINLVSPLDVIH